jgi:hypothetical protein
MTSHSELVAEVAKLTRWLQNSRRSGATKIVTSGYVLAPPFEIDFTEVGNIARVAVRSAAQSLHVDLNKVVCNQFRQAVHLLNFDDAGVLVGTRVLAPLTAAHQ